jgi:hypothetical protein
MWPKRKGEGEKENTVELVYPQGLGEKGGEKGGSTPLEHGTNFIPAYRQATDTCSPNTKNTVMLHKIKQMRRWDIPPRPTVPGVERSL